VRRALASFVEIATPVTTASGKRGELRKLRRRVDAAARRRQARIASAERIPSALRAPAHHRAPALRRHERAASAGPPTPAHLRHARPRRLDTADKAIACGNALRTFVPELLALSANSPFWQARDTGLASSEAGTSTEIHEICFRY